MNCSILERFECRTFPERTAQIISFVEEAGWPVACISPRIEFQIVLIGIFRIEPDDDFFVHGKFPFSELFSFRFRGKVFVPIAGYPAPLSIAKVIGKRGAEIVSTVRAILSFDVNSCDCSIRGRPGKRRAIKPETASQDGADCQAQYYKPRGGQEYQIHVGNIHLTADSNAIDDGMQRKRRLGLDILAAEHFLDVVCLRTTRDYLGEFEHIGVLAILRLGDRA